MSRLGPQYDIARPSGLCAATGEPLEPGAACIATLCERQEDDGFERKDFSLVAWEGGARPERLFSFWKTTVPHPNQKKRLFVDDDLLQNLFERLEGDERPQRIAFRFVIALVLMRKKTLLYVDRREEDGVELWRMRAKTPAGSPEAPTVDIINPRLTEEDVRIVSDQLGEILNGELD